MAIVKPGPFAANVSGRGCEDVITRPDLGDRAICLTLAPIAEKDRRPEAEVWREFELARPGILGVLLDAVVHGSRAINHVRLNHLPRMADFARWAAACETAFWPRGTFEAAYAANRKAAVERILEADPVATSVRSIMSGRTMWTGSASDLLRLCAESTREDGSVSPSWARTPRVLAARLRRAQTFLRALDIEIAFSQEGRSGERIIRMSALGRSHSGDLRSDNIGQASRT